MVGRKSIIIKGMRNTVTIYDQYCFPFKVYTIFLQLDVRNLETNRLESSFTDITYDKRGEHSNNNS